MNKLDCVIIGFDDFPLEAIATKAKTSRERSGDYAEIKRNSYLVSGKRIDFCGLLNQSAQHAVGFDPQLSAFELPNLGAFYLANYLQSRGIGVEIINLFNKQCWHLDNLLAEGLKAVIITTTYYVSPEPIQQIVSYVRARSPQTKIIIGGPFIAHICLAHTPAEQEIIFRLLGGDIFVIDPQGEETLARVMQALRDSDDDLSFVPNLVYRDRHGNGMTRTQPQPESNILQDNLIDWSRFPPDRFTPVTYMRTSRSCPFSCAFCSYPALGGQHHLMSVESVLQEMRQLHQFGTKHLIFTDDTFNVPLRRFKELLKAMITENFGFQWISFFRCSHSDDEAIDLMQQSGCLAVYLGIESGDEDVLRAMNKYATAERYRQGMRKLHEHNIITFGSFIIGHPGETVQTVHNTLDFIEETHPTFFNAQMFFLDPTAPIGQRREEFEISGMHYNWRHRSMSWEEASAWTDFTLKTVTNSIQLPLYGFSIWSIPYLLTHGFALEEVKSFAATAQAMMVKALDDQEGPYNEEQLKINQILHTWDARRLGDAGVREE